MRMVRTLLFSAVVLISSDIVSYAQQAKETATKPCQRGQSVAKIGGVDLDEIKCYLAMALQNSNMQNQMLVDLTAKNAMLQSDFDAAKSQIEDLKKQLEAEKSKTAPPQAESK